MKKLTLNALPIEEPYRISLGHRSDNCVLIEATNQVGAKQIIGHVYLRYDGHVCLKPIINSFFKMDKEV